MVTKQISALPMPTSESTHIMCGHVDSPPTGKQCLFCIYLNIISRVRSGHQDRIPIPFLSREESNPGDLDAFTRVRE